MSLEGEGRREKWQLALAAADKLRDRFGESAVSLAGGLGAGFPRAGAGESRGFCRPEAVGHSRKLEPAPRGDRRFRLPG